MRFPNPLKSVLWSKDGKFIGIATMNDIILVSVQTWEKLDQVCRPSEATACCWSPASDRFLIGSSDGIVTILGIREAAFSVFAELDGNDSPVYCLHWSNNGQFMLIGREDMTVTIYNAADICENFFFTQTEIMSRTLDSPARFLQFTSDSEYFGEILTQLLPAFLICS